MSALFFILGVAVILGLARINKSNKLFWTLLLALMMGFVGGTMSNVFAANNSTYVEKRAGLNQAMPTQGSAPQLDVKAIISQYTEELDILAQHGAKPVGQVYPIVTLNPARYSTNNNVCRVGNFVNLTNPGIAMNLFDTS